jgi:hypothetical protein
MYYTYLYSDGKCLLVCDGNSTVPTIVDLLGGISGIQLEKYNSYMSCEYI